MRTISVICIYCVCFLGSSHAQITTRQLLLNDSTASVLYLQAYNEMEITGLIGGDKVRIGQKPVRIGTGNIISFSPWEKKSDTLFIIRKNRIVFSQVYRIDSLSEPQARLGNIMGAFASINQVLAIPRILVYCPNTLYKGFRVLRFSFNYASGKEQGLPIESEGDRLPSEAQIIIRRLRPNDKLNFENIYVIGVDGTARVLPPFTITIQ